MCPALVNAVNAGAGLSLKYLRDNCVSLRYMPQIRVQGWMETILFYLALYKLYVCGSATVSGGSLQ